jgi:hypothetical protein
MRASAVVLGVSLLLASNAARADDVRPPPERKRVDPGLFAAGLTTAIVGGVALNVGSVVAIVGDDKSTQMTGVGVLLIGAAMIAGGIPLAILGGRKEPVTAPSPVQGQAGLVPIFVF